MTTPCSQSKELQRLAGAVTRLEQRDQFKDRLLADLKMAIDKIDSHMEKQTELMQKVAVQQEQITNIRTSQIAHGDLIDKLFKENRNLSNQLTSHKLEPAGDAKKLKMFTLQSIISAVVSGVVAAATALIALANTG